MPTAPGVRCRACRKLHAGAGLCLSCRRVADKARGSREERGYGARHRRLRAMFQARLDKGEDFRCWRCAKPIDPTYWTLGHCDENRERYHGPECPPCDYATQGRAGLGCPHPSHALPTCVVTVVCGPPCSGKSTWVRARARHDDLVLDYDEIAQSLGSPRSHGHHASLHPRIEAVIARGIAEVKAGKHERTWIIRSGVARATELATRLAGSMVLIDAPDAVLFQRADSRPDPDATRRAIREWRQANPTAPDISPDA